MASTACPSSGRTTPATPARPVSDGAPRAAPPGGRGAPRPAHRLDEQPGAPDRVCPDPAAAPHRDVDEGDRRRSAVEPQLEARPAHDVAIVPRGIGRGEGGGTPG